MKKGEKKSSTSTNQIKTSVGKKVSKKIDDKNSSKKTTETKSKVIKPKTKLLDLILKPRQYIKSTEDESYLHVLRKVFIVFIPYMVLFLIISTLAESLNFAQLILLFIDMVIGFIFVLFAIPAVLYLGVAVLKGKKSFLSIFRASSYMIMIFYIYLYITMFFSIVAPVDMSAINEINEIANGASQLPVEYQNQLVQENLVAFLSQPGAIINLILSIIALIHSLIILIIGISQTQNFSKVRAFFSIAISLSVFILLLVFISFLLQYAGV
jgi:hypothetical protein